MQVRVEVRVKKDDVTKLLYLLGFRNKFVGSSPIFCTHIILLKSLKFMASGIFFFDQKGLTPFAPLMNTVFKFNLLIKNWGELSLIISLKI